MEREHAKKGSSFSRRRFVGTTAAAALTAASWRRVLGANERVGIGFIGYGLIGMSHVSDFRKQPDANLVAAAEAHQGRLDQCAEACGRPVAKYRDFRKLLENKDVDAVVISTPDHWHALQTMLACAAGKDVYVEKPLTLFVREGRWMVEIAKRFTRVVQVGTQQRSGPHYQHARELIRAGRLGKVFAAHDDYHRNLMPGLGRPPDSAPPPDLDWEMFVGPSPMRPYNSNHGIYHFRWVWDFSGGQMVNWGQHSLDVVYWCLDLKGPTAVYSVGARRILDDNCDTPDVQETIFTYPNFMITISIRECCGFGEDRPLGFFGTNGTLHISRAAFQVAPDRLVPPINLFPGVRGGHPVGGPTAAPETFRTKMRTEARRESGKAADLLPLHARNFLECIKSRQTPLSDLESGHRVATALHLANLSARLGGRCLRWDAEKEEIVGDAEASAMLVRPYRKPWDAELRSLNPRFSP